VRAEAVRLFAERGFAAVGIRELAQSAGITSATLYHYVGSKDDLLVGIMERGLTDLLAVERRAVEAQDDPPARLAALVHAHAVSHAVAAEACRVIDTEVRALHGDARDRVVALRDEVEELWRSVVEEGTGGGWFRSPVPPRLLVRSLLDMATGVAAWYRPDGALAPSEIGAHLADVALRSVDARASSAADAPAVAVADLPETVTRLWDPRALGEDAR
jgi:AcrR family transcriptional regulator